MTRWFNTWRTLMFAALVTLAGCGGGNNTPSNTNNPAPGVPPTIDSQPADTAVPLGDTATFTVAGSGGSTPITYQWQRNGMAINGATDASYTTAATVLDDNGAAFTVVLSNSAGSVTSHAAILTVSDQPRPPVIDAQPADATVNSGANASFSVSASGNGALTYQWLRNGVPIAGATSASYGTAVSAADDGALYSVQVTNAAGTVSSVAATLHVNAPPQITTAPQDVATYVGQTASFTVTTTGTAPLAYQWRRNGTPISGATSATYSVGPLALSDTGATFEVVVTNVVGSATSAAATLTVSAPPAMPVITAQPQDITVLAARTATFSVSATSSTPLRYQWQRDGNAINGATAPSYTTGTLAYTETGSVFSVVVTNDAGSVTSRTATLTVNPRVVQVSAGGYLATARKEDGTVWNWGTSRYLGADGTTQPYGTMVRAMNVDGTLFNNIQSISTGYAHTLALKADGTLWAWGDNSEGSVGNGTIVDAFYPTRVLDSSGAAFSGVAAISGGWRYSLALKTDGTVWAWGYAAQGRLGNNNVGSATRRWTQPVAVLDTTGGQLAGVTQIEAGDDHAVALKSDGTVWIWGNGQAGRLGDGQRNSTGTVAKRLNDSTGNAINGVVQVSAGTDHSVVLKADGTAYAWGVNAYGQLSDGTTTERDWAVVMKDSSGNPLTGLSKVLAGEYCTVFLKTDGTVWMVGRNNFGQLGNGTSVASAMTPVQVLTSDGAALTNVKQIAVFDRTIVVLRTDDTVWAWGDDASGELGIAPTNQVQFYRSPQKVSVSGD